ncbi:MAG TPA: prepilin-type N-terminal cleavage/methylation domain-containing protein [Steroidobacteraceae bacterium]|nr:prepilin-type N-terminal cleavage/methylation domain-containing protein [Steroidobacteraceae bacterium]
MSMPARCRGVTLVELIVTIVVIAAAVSAVLAIVTSTAARSAENLVQTQAVIVAESYLNEILAKPFGSVCPAPCGRPQMDEVGDYDNLTDIGVHDENGNPVAGLGSYTVHVTVVGSSLGTSPVVLATTSMLVTVTVTPPNGAPVVLSGYRTQHP